MKPNLLIIGAQKAGTTFLGRKLSEHPQIFMVEPEIHYFNKAANLQKGEAWYEAHFAAGHGKKYVGEKTPNYLWTNIPPQGTDEKNVAEKIYRYAPHAKLLVLLRNPVKRAVSAFNHHYRMGRFSPFVSADEYLVGSRQHEAEKYGVLSMGLYHMQLSEYLRFFPRQQMLVLIYEEDVSRNPEAGLKQCLQFLELDTGFQFSNTRDSINAGRNAALTNFLHYYLPFSKGFTHVLNRVLPPAADRQLSAEGSARLQQFYAPENEKLFAFLQRSNPWQ